MITAFEIRDWRKRPGSRDSGSRNCNPGA